MLNKYKTITTYDQVTSFRLLNVILVTFGLNIILPIIIDLRGELLSASVISLFMIMGVLAVKVNSFMVERFSISTLYKFGTVLHTFLLIVTGFYFFNQELFIVLDYMLGILLIASFSSYSIKLDVHLADNHPEDVQRFKIFRASVIADATLLGLGIASAISYFVSTDAAIWMFLIYHSAFELFLIFKWNYFDKLNLKEI